MYRNATGNGAWTCWAGNGQSLITGVSEGYDLWKKSKAEEGITAIDFGIAVFHTTVSGLQGASYGRKNGKEIRREISGMKASTKNYKRAKCGGKRGVVTRKKQKLSQNRKRFVKGHLNRSKLSKEDFILRAIDVAINFLAM